MTTLGELGGADYLHVGAPEFMPELAGRALERAKQAGATTSVDILADGWPEMLDHIAPALPHTDSAGFLHGLSLGHGPADAARLGSACAALVAQGLGSDAGEFDLDAAQRFAADTPTS